MLPFRTLQYNNSPTFAGIPEGISLVVADVTLIEQIRKSGSVFNAEQALADKVHGNHGLHTIMGGCVYTLRSKQSAGNVKAG